MNASEGSAPGPTPNITRPRVMWSSCSRSGQPTAAEIEAMTEVWKSFQGDAN